MPNRKLSLMLRLRESGSPAPINRPVRASPAYAKPSIMYEKRVKNCISNVFIANTLSPYLEPAMGKNENTAIRQTVRRNISRLTLKKRFICLRLILLRQLIRWRIKSYRRQKNAKASPNPVYWAITVPRATPSISSRSTKTNINDITILTILTAIAIIIGIFEFCIPINHPLKPYISSVAGAAHILT